MKQLEWTFQLPHYACDFQGTWAPNAILAWMQEISAAHSVELGIGRVEMLKEDVVWILSRIEVEMDFYPAGETEIVISTFPTENRRWFFPRYYIFKTPSGKVLGKASALWVLVNIRERKMVPPDMALPFMPDNRDLTPPMGLPGRSKTVDGKEKSWQYKPLAEDIDINGHVNNTRYMNWLYNGLGIEVFRNHVLSSFCINYDTEILPDANITLSLHQTEEECSLTGKDEEKNYFEISAVLRKRRPEERYL